MLLLKFKLEKEIKISPVNGELSLNSIYYKYGKSYILSN